MLGFEKEGLAPRTDMALSLAATRRLLPRLRPTGSRGFYHMHGDPNQVVRVPSPLSVARLTKMDYKINGMMEVGSLCASVCAHVRAWVGVCVSTCPPIPSHPIPSHLTAPRHPTPPPPRPAR